MLQLSILLISFVDILLLKALRVLDRTWFPIKTTVLNIDTWTLGISIYIYIYIRDHIIYIFVVL